MPGFDGTGPRGQGPMTGGGRGFCTLPPGSAGAAYRGRFMPGTYGAYGATPAQAELDQLRDEFALLKNELEAIEARLKSMEAQKNK
ncbi:MAG: DUF5320 domain-containing protein [Dehalococcoidia bacterium]|nr:DUF5320 domain-containing protein [Dehalococcoidia bacterium]